MISLNSLFFFGKLKFNVQNITFKHLLSASQAEKVIVSPSKTPINLSSSTILSPYDWNTLTSYHSPGLCFHCGTKPRGKFYLVALVKSYISKLIGTYCIKQICLSMENVEDMMENLKNENISPVFRRGHLSLPTDRIH